MKAPSSRRALLAGLAGAPFVAAPVAASLADTSASPPAPVDPHVAREAQAVALFRHLRASEWGWSSPGSSPECKAADDAHRAVMDFAKDACGMAPPTTLAGLGTFALTLALAMEQFADTATMDLDERMLCTLIEAVVKVSGATFPAEFRGLTFDPQASEDER